jgi:hypothetical protein
MEPTARGNRVPWDGHLSLLLFGMVQAYRLRGQRTFCTRTGGITMPRVDPDLARGYSTNYAYLVHFGFCTKPAPAVFELTEAAFRYVDGEESAPDYIIARKAEVIERGPRTVPASAVSNVEDLQANPLWWENYEA